MLLLAYNDISGNFYYKNPKEGVQGFPVVPNKSAMRWGKPQRMRLELVRFIGSVYEIHAWNVT